MSIPGIKLVAICSCVFAVIFVVIGGFLDGYSLPSVISLAFIGMTFGAIAAPIIEPKAFRYPTLWQIAISTTVSVLVAALLGTGVDGYFFAIAIGIVIGYFAPCWVKYVTGP